ncbi:MAG: amino acid adenylation domain-containing protein [Candidatus Margulisiibacteriota bacterium]|jgi:amino acid adenylation domain-containing protein/thioester reductase-like protein
MLKIKTSNQKYKTTQEEEILPLSYIQQDLWAISKMYPKSCTYNTFFSAQITSPVNISALKAFFQLVINRHKILRANFFQANSCPYQKITPQIVDFNETDASHWDLSQLKKAVINVYKTPFNLEKDRLFRVHCFRRSKESTILVISIHHIVFDAWSVSILFKEFNLMYQNIASSMPVIMPNLKHQYKDFVSWQNNFVQSEDSKLQLQYWQSLIGSEIPVLNISPKTKQTSIMSLEGKTHFFKFSKPIIERIKTVFPSVTLNSFFLSVFHILLHKYSGSELVISGSPRFSRLRTTFGLSRSDFNDNVGCFVNIILNKTSLNNDPVFLDFVEKNQEVNTLVFKNQDYPFSRLINQLNLKQKNQNVPQTNFVYQKKGKGQDDLSFLLFNVNEAKSVMLGGLEFRPFYVPHEDGRHELEWELLESDNTVYCNLKYQTSLFDKAFIQRMAGHLSQIIKSVLTNPKQKISEIDILTPKEKEQILVEFNNTAASYPKDKTIHQLFEKQVARTPNNTALVFQDQKLTYQELNDKANQLAKILQAKGVNPDTIVSIMTERSFDMIIGIMGILKAGGAYLPIDPNLPEDRIQYMLEDSKAQILLTQAKFIEDPKFLFLKSSKILTSPLDFPFEGGIREDVNTANLNTSNTPQNLAYIIYTSGSTGKPKGVMVEHKSVINLLYYLQEKYPILENDAYLLKTSYTFDVSVSELFGWILGQGKLVILNPKEENNPQAIFNILAKEAVTHLNFVPSMALAFVNTLKSKLTNLNLKYIFIAGEAFPENLFKKLNQCLTKTVKIENLYGPTEATVYATGYNLARKNKNVIKIPIGTPLTNIKALILDKNQNIVPIQMPGELHIAGDCLARGYLNNTELTNQKFITNPFNPKEKMYKTGDLTRWLPDGDIEFLGRIDHQVKIRGFRIELGEIETEILKHENIIEAVVLAREDEPGIKRLAAYFVLKEKSCTLQTTFIAKLKALLSTKLPEYMIPAFFIELEQMPLNNSGKIDRKALPKPDTKNINQNHEFIAPETKTEKILAEIWLKLLNLEKVGVSDNFFELGGDSLLVIQLLIEINNRFKISIETQDIIYNPTIKMSSIIIDNFLKGKNPNKKKINFIKEANLDSNIYPATKFDPKKFKIEHIFITGATGFLGSFLLAELLSKTKAKIYCLVRAKDKEIGFLRLKEKLILIDHWHEEYTSRLIPILGDLSQPQLGISNQTWVLLGKKIDVIYHNGAMVNFIYPYDQLKPSNVLGTKEVIKIACANKAKPIYYVSTLSVFDSIDFSKSIAYENDPLAHSKGFTQGYAQSKWVAEKLILTAKKRGLPVTIFRPGRITGDLNSKYMCTEELFSRFVKGLIQLKSAPNLKITTDLMPVDITSKAIVYPLLKNSKYEGEFHLTNPNTFSIKDLTLWLNEFGFKIKTLPYQEWVEILKQDKQNTLAPLLPLFTTKVSDNKSIVELTSDKDTIRFSINNTNKLLKNSNIFQFPDNKILMKKYIDYFRKVGFLKTF